MAPISDIQRQTYTDIYTTYSGKLFGVCLHYVKDREVANDLLHDSFIVIFSSLDQLRDRSRIEPWMCSIVRNIALKHLRNTKKMPETGLESIPEPAFEENTANISEIPLNDLLKVIDELPEQYGKVFRLSVLDGLSHKEIGEIMGIAPHSSSSNLARAKQMLRKVISQNWGILITFCLCIVAVLFITRPEDESGITAENIVFDIKASDNPEIMIAGLIPAKDLKALPERKSSDPEESTPEPEIHEPETSLQEEDDSYTYADAAVPAPEYKEPDWEDDREEDDKRLAFGFSGSISNSGSSRQVTAAPDPGFDMTPPGYEDPSAKQYTHFMPVSFAASVRYTFEERWALASGLRYTYLHSEVSEEMGIRKYSQDIHYIGIPLQVLWEFWYSRAISAYASAGATFEIPVAARHAGKHMDIPCQWSAGLGVGIQYNLTPHIGLYVEPELYRYFNNESQYQTIRTERPMSITVPIGIRFTW